jgi:hypothetical protein
MSSSRAAAAGGGASGQGEGAQVPAEQAAQAQQHKQRKQRKQQRPAEQQEQGEGAEGARAPGQAQPEAAAGGGEGGGASAGRAADSTPQEVMVRVIEHADLEMADDPPFDADEAQPDPGGYASDTEDEDEPPRLVAGTGGA